MVTLLFEGVLLLAKESYGICTSFENAVDSMGGHSSGSSQEGLLLHLGRRNGLHHRHLGLHVLGHGHLGLLHRLENGHLLGMLHCLQVGHLGVLDCLEHGHLNGRLLDDSRLD